jgi:type IV secretory pathway VirB3-like protein
VTVVIIIIIIVVILLVVVVVLVIVLVVVIVAVNAPDCFFHLIFYAFRRCMCIRNAVITLKSPAVSSFS